MSKYSVFTNIYKGQGLYQNSNNYKVLHANTVEEVQAIRTQLASEGYLVTKVTTNLGTIVNI